MSDEPSNSVIVEMLKGFRELTEQKFASIQERMEERSKQDRDAHQMMTEHIDLLRKENVKNTHFREKWSTIFIVVSSGVVVLVPIAQYVVIHKFM